jgi:sugar lactone lactonase YvrE
MEDRLKAENFQTLDLHRAVANADNAFRLEHSTAIISARGDAYDEGIVLDPWRKGGRLTWVSVREDRMYDWEPRNEVVARALERKHGQIVTLTDDQRLLVGGVEYAAQ